MKTTMILILFLFLFIGCEKDCKTCTTVTTCTGGTTTKEIFEACGKDLKDIDGKVISATATYGGITVTCTSRTTCK